MTPIRDVFRGWRIVLERNAQRFRVSMIDNGGRLIVATVTKDRAEALSLAEEWLFIIGDDREFVTVDMEEARQAVKDLLDDAVRTMRMEDHEEQGLADLEDWFSRQWDGER